MKILQLISSGGPYGIEAMLRNLTVELNRLGCNCFLGVFRNSREPHLEVADAAASGGVNVEVFPCEGRLDLRVVRALRLYAVTNDIQMIHTHGYKADLYGLAAAKTLHLPVVTTHHMHSDEHKLTLLLRLYCLADKLTVKYFDKVIAVSEPIARSLRAWRVAEPRLRVINNGTDVTRFPGLPCHLGPRTGKRIGFVGRLTTQKGVYELIEAARQILPIVPDARFYLVGDGFESGAVAKRIEAAGVEEAVKMLGTFGASDMPGLYASFDIVALPSYNEGLPMTVLEALAAGCAVVASRVGAVPTVIEDGQTGLLIPPRNMEELKRALLELLTDPNKATELGRNGQMVVRERYSAHVMAESYLSLYREVVAHC